jgi:predicted component of viral defense system (DUF524 family)
LPAAPPPAPHNKEAKQPKSSPDTAGSQSKQQLSSQQIKSSNEQAQLSNQQEKLSKQLSNQQAQLSNQQAKLSNQLSAHQSKLSSQQPTAAASEADGEIEDDEPVRYYQFFQYFFILFVRMLGAFASLNSTLKSRYKIFHFICLGVKCT